MFRSNWPLHGCGGIVPVERESAMADAVKETTANQVGELLTQYSFDLGGYAAHQLVSHWMQQFPAHWLKIALVEALYQGRYKAISIEQLLTFWQRRGQPIYHFNAEFERIICGKFARGLMPWSQLKGDEAPATERAIAPYPERSAASATPTAADTTATPTTDRPPQEAVPKPAAEPTAPPVETLLPPTPPNHNGERAMLPSEPVTTLEMKTVVDFGLPPLENGPWAIAEVVKHPIHQFVPAVDPSEFYSRLKAVVEGSKPASEAPTDREEAQLRRSPD